MAELVKGINLDPLLSSWIIVGAMSRTEEKDTQSTVKSYTRER